MVRVTCGCCLGVGTVELTGEYLTTLRALAAAGEAHGAALAKILGCKGTAACNRLVALEKHGLVESRRHGRKKFYKVAKELS